MWVPSPVTLYNANCTKSSAKVSVVYDPATGALTLNLIGATPGAVHFVAVKYNPNSLIGTPITAPNPTVTYNFVTSLNGGTLPTGVVTLKVAPK